MQIWAKPLRSYLSQHTVGVATRESYRPAKPKALRVAEPGKGDLPSATNEGRTAQPARD